MPSPDCARAGNFRQISKKINSVSVFFISYPGSGAINIPTTVKKRAFNLIYDDIATIIFLVINFLFPYETAGRKFFKYARQIMSISDCRDGATIESDK